MNLKLLIVLAGLCALSLAMETDNPTFTEEAETKYFSPNWKTLYSKKMLSVQPEWTLAENQPDDAAYEVREYEEAYWISSSNYKKCWSQEEAGGQGYINIYFYLAMGFNHQKFKYDLTYPIVTRVETIELPETKKPKRRGGKRYRRRQQCRRTKHSAMSYIPAEKDSEVATPAHKTLETELIPQRTVYVKEYCSNYTAEYCNQQASALAKDLVQDGVSFDPDDYYCAKYIPGISETENRYEVWFFGVEAATEEEEEI